MILFHKSWNGYSDSVAYHNNIFYSGHPGNSIDLSKSTRNIFDNNLYFGNIVDLPEDLCGILSNPDFTGSPGTSTGWKSWIVFLLQEGSPAIDNGMNIKGMPSEDFRGVEINEKPDIGPLEFSK